MSNYKGSLTITVMKAENLPSASMVANNDPYVQLKVPGTNHKTRVVNNGGRNPEWFETFQFALSGAEEAVQFEVIDQRKLGDTLLGWIDIVVSELVGRPDPTWYRLLKKDRSDSGRLLLSTKYEGEMPYGSQEIKAVAKGETVSIDRLLPDFHQYLVEVHIIAARNLKNADLVGESDPYCIVHFDRNTAKRTRVIDDNLNPVWDHKLYSLVPPGDHSILVEIFDKDDTSDNGLGSVTLHLAGNFERRQGWYPLRGGLLSKDQGELHVSYVKMKTGDLVGLRSRLDAALDQVQSLKDSKRALLEQLQAIQTTSEKDKQAMQSMIAALKADDAMDEKTKAELASQVAKLQNDVSSWSQLTEEEKKQKAELETSLISIKQQLEIVKQDDAHKEAATQELTEQLRNITAQMLAFKEDSESKKQQLESELHSKSIEALSLNERVAKLQTELLTLQEGDAKDKERQAQLEQQLNIQNSKLGEIQAEKDRQEQELKNQMAALQTQLQQAEASKSEDEKSKSALNAEIARLAAEIAKVTANDDHDRFTISELTAENQRLKTQLAKYQQKKILTEFSQVWCDAGTRAKSDVGIHRPNVPQGYIVLGDIAENGHNRPTFTVAFPDDQTIFAAPTGYDLVWKDSGSGAKQDGSIWLPRAPQGFVSVGCVGQKGYDAPNIPNIRCVKADMVRHVSATQVWTDEGTGSKMDCSIWKVNNGLNTFMAVRGYNTPHSRFGFDF